MSHRCLTSGKFQAEASLPQDRHAEVSKSESYSGSDQLCFHEGLFDSLHNGDWPPIPAIRRTFLNAFRPNPSGRHMVSCRTAIFLISTGTRHVQEIPAGKNAISPGPNRRSSPLSWVMKASPETTKRVSSLVYSHRKVPAVHSQTTIFEVQ